jgi:hypothetical protein
MVLSTIPIITHLWNTDFAHWWAYYFAGGSKAPEPNGAWYERGVWGNVFAVLPLAPVGVFFGTCAYFWHKGVVRDLEAEVEKHKHHSKALDDLMGLLDPGRDDGGLHARIEHIEQLADETLPGGVTAVIEEIRKRKL